MSRSYRLFLLEQLAFMTSAKDPGTAAAVADPVGALDRRHTNRQVEIERAKPPADQKEK